jgi:hypothetical protein
MPSREPFASFSKALLLAAGTAGIALALAWLAASSAVAGADLRRDFVVRAADLSALNLAADWLQGPAALVVAGILVLLGLGLCLGGLSWHLRRRESKGRAALWPVVGLAVGALLAALVLPWWGGFQDHADMLNAAGMGAGVMVGAIVVPQLWCVALLGGAAGWWAGAFCAPRWSLRLVVAALGFVPWGTALVIAAGQGPDSLEMDAELRELRTGPARGETTMWVFGEGETALPVTLDLDALAGSDEEDAPRVSRHNVNRAKKILESTPPLHPQSLAADRLLVAGALAELDGETAATRLLEKLRRRGQVADGELLATVVQGLAPTAEAMQVLEELSDPSKFVLGAQARASLCPLAQRSDQAELIQRWQCPGKAPAARGEISATLVLKGRPLRRTPAALLAPAKGLQAPWIDAGLVPPQALPIVASGQTDAQGTISFKQIPPGDYLLAVVPRRYLVRDAQELKLAQPLSIVVPEKGEGVVALGEIQLGKGGPRARPGMLDGVDLPPALKGMDLAALAGIESPMMPDDVAAAMAAAQEEASAGQVGEPIEPGEVPGTDKAAPRPPLPRQVRDMIAKVTEVSANRTKVPEGFGTALLEADRALFAPQATVVPREAGGGRRGGLEVQGIWPHGVVAALGFQEGDLIESVNGRRMSQPEDLVGLVEPLGRTRRVLVRLRRQGRTVLLRIDVDR